jgi:hypothetical protein
MALKNPKRYYIKTDPSMEINRKGHAWRLIGRAMHEPLFQEHRLNK